ncbi:C39 family peptidase [Akkermansiaceae bacterium]|nr:C39 family peptidase [Akkermansiaceae bacterium]MDC1206652.1 C39 family peptidase [Akkermansiaceae bacterium]
MKKVLPLLVLLPSFLLAEDKGKRQPLDKTILSPAIWGMSLEEIQKTHEIKGAKSDTREIPEELRKQLKEKGIDISEVGSSSGGFEWLSSAKQGLRAPAGIYSLLGMNVGEVNLRSSDGKLANGSVSLYNRGDDGEIRKDEYQTRLGDWKSALDEALKVRASDRSKAGAVNVDGWMWKKGDTAFLLEGSVTKKTNRVEFIRLRLASVRSTHHDKRVKSRGSLDDNLIEKNGDVYIGNIPMVDQGQKGYCVVASVERVARYYGLDVDQHELAQLANTDNNGTTGDDMEKAFKKLTGKLHVRTMKLMDYDYRQVVSDYKAYNREAKKINKAVESEGTGDKVKEFDINLRTHRILPQGFWYQLDKDTFKVVKKDQAKYRFFKDKIESFVDEGVPICWTLYLGMFPEKGLPQSFGGHMRLIVGYNEEKEEILYTDSWGEGHGMKRMSMVEAWCMTMGVYAMVPNR